MISRFRIILGTSDISYCTSRVERYVNAEEVDLKLFRKDDSLALDRDREVCERLKM